MIVPDVPPSKVDRTADRPDIADGAESSGWTVTDPTPLPEAREPEEVLDDLRALPFTSDPKPRAMELAQEQLFAPQLMLPLVGDYHVCFGGPRLARGPMDMAGKIDSLEVDPVLAGVKKSQCIKRRSKHIPSVVFDIGQLYLDTHNVANDPSRQPTDYRVVLDMKSGAIWLLYEYYKFDLDGREERIKFSMNKTMKAGAEKSFDLAQVLSSVREWTNSLTIETITHNIKKSCCMSHAYITPVLSSFVEVQLKKSPKRHKSWPWTKKEQATTAI